MPEKANREYVCEHRERFIFSGLSNRRGRYVHALAAINDLISVSFHLWDYEGVWDATREGGRGRKGKWSVARMVAGGWKESALPVFHPE